MFNCSCLSGCGGVAIPRLLFLGMWVFTPFVRAAFNGPFLPILGLLFLPFTAMAYAFFAGGGGMSLFGWIVVGLAFVLDIGVFTGAAFVNKDQIPSWKKKGFENP